jgi:hypothetical protein
MSILSRLFGGKGGGAAAPGPEPIEHKGFQITPEPIREGKTYRISARITKEIDGEVKEHHLIRADTLEGADAAADASVAKAKQMIDQMGDNVFGGDWRRPTA